MTDGKDILLVDDEADLCMMVDIYLTEHGYRVAVVHNGRDMRERIEQQSPRPDIVVLDVVLPEENGLTLAQWLRTGHPDIGIIMLTGRGETIDRIIGLEIGADDYLAKPFHLRELLARINSLARRRARPAEAAATLAVPLASSAGSRAQLNFAGWLFDGAARALFSPAGDNVRLTKGEFDLLAAFVSHPNQLLSRERLLDLTRSGTAAAAGPFDRTIDVQIGRLRRKLNDDPEQPRIIRTVRGSGYLFIATVEVAAAGASQAATRTPEASTLAPTRERGQDAAAGAAAAYSTSAPGAGQ
jgi:two-component system, OmpR family, response regulator